MKPRPPLIGKEFFSMNELLGFFHPELLKSADSQGNSLGEVHVFLLARDRCC